MTAGVCAEKDQWELTVQVFLYRLLPSNFNNVYTFTDVNFHANKLSITYDPNIHRPHRVTFAECYTVAERIINLNVTFCRGKLVSFHGEINPL